MVQARIATWVIFWADPNDPWLDLKHNDIFNSYFLISRIVDTNIVKMYD